MIITTRRFGDLTIDPAKIISFPRGLIGFERYTRFVVLPFAEGTPFELLQAVDEKDLALVMLDPFLINNEYHFDVADEDLEILQVKERNELTIRVVVTLPQDLRQMTANLQGPILVNEKRLLGEQIVLVNANYSVKTPILPAGGDNSIQQ